MSYLIYHMVELVFSQKVELVFYLKWNLCSTWRWNSCPTFRCQANGSLVSPPQELAQEWKLLKLIFVGSCANTSAIFILLFVRWTDNKCSEVQTLKERTSGYFWWPTCRNDNRFLTKRLPKWSKRCHEDRPVTFQGSSELLLYVIKT